MTVKTLIPKKFSTPAHIDVGDTVHQLSQFIEISDKDYRSIHLPCLPFKEIDSEPTAGAPVTEAGTASASIACKMVIMEECP